MNTPLFTQCWQIEPGENATSYIPSDWQIGIREEDSVTVIDTGAPVTVDEAGLNDAIRGVIPAGSIAWTTVPG
jgi:hypothetical protein